MSQFVINISESKAASAFLEFIGSLNFIKKVERISADELDNRIIRLGKSIKKRNVSESEILSVTKSFRRKYAE